MAGGLREFFKTKGGQIAGIVAACVMLVICAYALWNVFGPSDSEAASSSRTFMDASYSPPKAFKRTLKPGMTVPVEGPSGKQTGYPAEMCYWTKDGGTKKDPTPVLLNEYIGKAPPTFCPDCGRLVRPHNPAPQSGGKPPPTKQEYEANRRPHSDANTER